jgi:hypothetical protein
MSLHLSTHRVWCPQGSRLAVPVSENQHGFGTRAVTAGLSLVPMPTIALADFFDATERRFSSAWQNAMNLYQREVRFVETAVKGTAELRQETKTVPAPGETNGGTPTCGAYFCALVNAHWERTGLDRKW